MKSNRTFKATPITQHHFRQNIEESDKDSVYSGVLSIYLNKDNLQFIEIVINKLNLSFEYVPHQFLGLPLLKIFSFVTKRHSLLSKKFLKPVGNNGMKPQ